MTTYGSVHQAASRPRRIIFLSVAGIVFLAFCSSTPNVLAPWLTVNVEHLSDPSQARWSLALEGIVDLLWLACIAVTMLRPARSALLMQYLLYGATLAAVVVLPFTGPTFLLPVILLLLVPAAYPYPRELFSLRSQRAPSWGVLTVAVIAAGILAALAAEAIHIQAKLPRGTGSDFNILATDAEHLLLLALAGLLAATRRPGWRVLAAGVTVTYAYLGLASLLLPNQPNTWGAAGGIASLLGSAAFAITAVTAARNDTAHTVQPPSTPKRRLRGASAAN
jgi:hypothetical protein